jgi:pentatricopeptide repeat protein
LPITRQTLNSLTFNHVLTHLVEVGREEEARSLWREIPKVLSKPYTELAGLGWLEVQRLLIEANNGEVMKLLSSLDGGDEIVYSDCLEPKEAARIMARQSSTWNLFKMSQIRRH